MAGASLSFTHLRVSHVVVTAASSWSSKHTSSYRNPARAWIIVTYPHSRGIRFVFNLASQFFLSFFLFFLPISFFPILLGKGSVLFLALCDL